MTSYDRRAVLKCGVAALVLPVLARAPAKAALSQLTVWGPPAAPSIPLIHAVASGRPSLLAKEVTFKSWRSPDELRAGLTSHTMDVFILATQTAANLFNRGLGVRLVNVMTDGLLYIVTADASLNDVPSLTGKKIAVPYRNDPPEIILRRLLELSGLKPEKDLSLQYVGSQMEAVQFLLTGRVDAAVLPEPATTAAISKSGVARPLFRSIDIQKAWGSVSGASSTLPLAGLGVTERFLTEHADTIEGLQAALEKAVVEVNANPDAVGQEAASALGIPPEVIGKSIPYANLRAQRAKMARSNLETFYSSIAASDPNIIGGKLPAAEFYL